MPETLEIRKESDVVADELIFSATHQNCTHILYDGAIMPKEHVLMLFKRDCSSAKGIEPKRLLALAKMAFDANILLTPLSAKKLAKMEHKGKAESFIENYLDAGLTKCKQPAKEETAEHLTKLFEAEKRFNGRTPKILFQIAATCDAYGIEPHTAVNKFSIQNVRQLLTNGVSKVEAVLLYTHLTEQQLGKMTGNLYISQMVSTLIDKAYKKSNSNIREQLVNAALWIADHTDTDVDFLKKVYDKAPELVLNKDVSIANVRTQFSNRKAVSEVAKIEKAYKACGFKLRNCVCELQRTTTVTDRYKAEILEGDDPRQVMLGYDTDCCQHLGEAGESAMMHGLLHPKAGFWVVTKKDSGKVVAQAEAWELNRRTLVFDNIEFANDAEIDQYKEIIGKWVKECNYKNVIMGCGYNMLDNGSFEQAGAVKPPVTPYELYVLSYEEDSCARDEICYLSSERKAKELMDSGEITYYDYVYCDSENTSVYLKKNDRIASFFDPVLQKETNEEEEERE